MFEESDVHEDDLLDIEDYQTFEDRYILGLECSSHTIQPMKTIQTGGSQNVETTESSNEERGKRDIENKIKNHLKIEETKKI